MEFISCIKNFPKHCKTALQNVYRNGVMSVSSVFSVTIMLLLIGLIGTVSVNIYDMTYKKPIGGLFMSDDGQVADL
jgi:cell division transport system permease protein